MSARNDSPRRTSRMRRELSSTGIRRLAIPGLVTVGLQVQPRTIIISLVVGTLVTVIAAVVPAIRASRIPPVAAMRDDFVLPTASLRRSILIPAAPQSRRLVIEIDDLRNLSDAVAGSQGPGERLPKLMRHGHC